MSTPTQTPRTDEALICLPRHPGQPINLIPFGTVVTSDFARTLEGELAELQANLEWMEEWTPSICSDAWTCSVDMAGNRWTVSLRIDGPRQKFRGRTLMDAIRKARTAWNNAHPQTP